MIEQHARSRVRPPGPRRAASSTIVRCSRRLRRAPTSTAAGQDEHLATRAAHWSHGRGLVIGDAKPVAASPSRASGRGSSRSASTGSDAKARTFATAARVKNALGSSAERLPERIAMSDNSAPATVAKIVWFEVPASDTRRARGFYGKLFG